MLSAFTSAFSRECRALVPDRLTGMLFAGERKNILLSMNTPTTVELIDRRNSYEEYCGANSNKVSRLLVADVRTFVTTSLASLPWLGC